MSRDPRWARLLMACYPDHWRRRYGDEYAALLTDLLEPAPWTRRPALVADVLRGALDARLNPKGTAMADRLPVPTTTAVWAAGLFTLAGIGFQKLTDDPQLAAAEHQQAAIEWSFGLLAAAAMIALLSLVVSALPAAAAVLRGRVHGTWRLLAVPPLAVALWYGVLRLALLPADHRSAHSAPGAAAAALVTVTGIAALAATAWTADTVLRRVQAVGATRMRRVTLTVLAAGMAATTLACLAWGLAVRTGDPGAFASRSSGLMATPFQPSWTATLVLMASATALACHALRQERTAGTAVRGQR